jgi:hypothetical protein
MGGAYCALRAAAAWPIVSTERDRSRSTFPEASPTTGSDARGTTQVLELGAARWYETDQRDESPAFAGFSERPNAASRPTTSSRAPSRSSSW